MSTNEDIYDALSDALGDDDNVSHDGAVSAIGTLKHQRDLARRMVVNAREALSEALGRDAMSPSLVKDADGAHLMCSVCRALLEEKVDPEYLSAAICPEGQGCGVWDTTPESSGIFTEQGVCWVCEKDAEHNSVGVPPGEEPGFWFNGMECDLDQCDGKMRWLTGAQIDLQIKKERS